MFSELTINTWNRPFVLVAVDFAMELASRLPVYRLDCQIDPAAMEAAKAVLD